ncbi:MAG: 3-hydroxybutyrate oligomer hydrolase family protein [Pseudonocardiaceae bacterium]
MRAIPLHRRFAVIVLAVTLLSGCTSDDSKPKVNTKPPEVGTITKVFYDGSRDDLLTAGLGRTGLGASAPTPADPAAPTAAELRRLAIFSNYTALVDVNPKGGFGTLFGPNIDVNGTDTLGEGKIAGNEYLAYLDDGTGRKNVTVMVQIPSTWNRGRPCIVTATSSGSRGIYGAIGTAGEWGLKRGCAVAYTDKGTGSGVHDLATHTVNMQTGLRADATTAGTNSNFTAALTAPELSALNSTFPQRIAMKHAHSERNPEKDWGRDTLSSIRLATYLLNEERGETPNGSTSRSYGTDNTIVIASSVSNGGGAAVAAAEQDTEGLIDGVVVGEPVLQLGPVPGLTIRRGATVQGSGRPLFDYLTLANLHQPCASLSTRVAGSFGIPAVLPAPAIAANRCAALKARGLLTTATTADQAEEALDILIAAGFQPESNLIQATHFTLAVPAVTTAYANAYGRFSVRDRLCDLSYAGIDPAGAPAPIAPTTLAQIFGLGNGVPPTGGIQIINNVSVGGPLENLRSVTPSTGVQDFNVDSAICLRTLSTGGDGHSGRVRNGVREVLRTGNLRGKPAIIVAGRADALIPVNFNTRPYFGLNKATEGPASKLSYIEVTNAQHFDAFIDNPQLPGYDTAFIPLHHYFIQAMNRMWASLTTNAPLPPSQLVRTTPRGGTPGQAPPITATNLPPISQTPTTTDQINYHDNLLQIPD